MLVFPATLIEIYRSLLKDLSLTTWSPHREMGSRERDNEPISIFGRK